MITVTRKAQFVAAAQARGAVAGFGCGNAGVEGDRSIYPSGNSRVLR